MTTVTYITNTNVNPTFAHTTIVNKWREGLDEWFEAELPDDEVSDLRAALTEAAERLTGEDRALLEANGFEVTTIPVKFTKDDEERWVNSRPASGDDLYMLPLAPECERVGLTNGCDDFCETLTVLDELGGNVNKFLP